MMLNTLTADRMACSKFYVAISNTMATKAIVRMMPLTAWVMICLSVGMKAQTMPVVWKKLSIPGGAFSFCFSVNAFHFWNSGSLIALGNSM